MLFVFCERFHDCCWALGANAKDEPARRALVGNLFDEYGAGDPSQGHLVLMRRLMYSLGYDDMMLSSIRLNAGAQSFMDEILRVCRDDPWMKGIGCICLGAECNGSAFFRQIHQALQRKPCMQDADLNILEIHAADDVEHRQRMLDLIAPYLDEAENRRLLHEGYLASIQLFSQLWTSMLYYDGLPAAA